jgi:hypothetical protein
MRKQEWQFVYTGNNPDFAGEIRTEDSECICAVYSQRHLKTLSDVPDMVEIIKTLIPHAEAAKFRDGGAMVKRMQEIVKSFNP